MSEFGGAISRGRNLFMGTGELPPQSAECLHLRFELAWGGGVGFSGGITEHYVSRRIPGGNSRHAAIIADLLTPTIFGGSEAVVTGEAVEFGIFRPSGTAGAASKTLQTVAQLHALAYRPLLGSKPRSIVGILPVAGHHGAEQIEFEGQVRMAGPNHLVIDGFFLASHMAMKAGVAADFQGAPNRHCSLGFLVGGAPLPALF